MKVLLSGGGSGGHVTPLKYIARELKLQNKQHEIYYIGPRNDIFSHLLTQDAAIEQSYTLFSGKWRRYKNETFTHRLLDVRTNILNVRDFFYVFIGIVQAIILLIKIRPNIILLKGGFVCVPVGIAAHLLRIPFVTHDSDTIAGLANRVVGRWAVVNAVGQQEGAYPYGADTMQVVGVPINPDFINNNDHLSQNDYKKKLQLNTSLPVVFSMGGSLGSDIINKTIIACMSELIAKKIQLIHISGSEKATSIHAATENYVDAKKFIKVVQFEDNPKTMLSYYLAADIVISRAGTTSISELSALKKTSIIIPASQLADQIANVSILEKNHAAYVIKDNDLLKNPKKLLDTIELLLTDKKKATTVAKNLHKFNNHNATAKIVQILTDNGQG